MRATFTGEKRPPVQWSIATAVGRMFPSMKDQVASISENGLSAVFISDKDATLPTVKREI